MLQMSLHRERQTFVVMSKRKQMCEHLPKNLTFVSLARPILFLLVQD